MQYKNTIEAVYVHLDEIQQIAARFGAEGEVRNIDIDLSLEKLRDVYDILLTLRNTPQPDVFSKTEEQQSVLRNNTKTGNTMPANEEAVSEPPQTEAIIEHQEPIEENVLELLPQVEETKIEEPKVKPIEKKKEATQAEIHSRVKPTPQTKYLGETFASEKPSLNDELANDKKKSDLSSRLKTKPINSLNGAIGLNEKFEFIQNLFGGDSAKYDHAIGVLNMATHFNEAYDYLSNSHNFNMDDPLVQKLLELIRRKLIVGKNG